MTDKPPHTMLDIETWGTKPDATIISIGACIFDPYSDEILDRFYVAVEPESCLAVGRSLDVSTLIWWMDAGRDVPRRRWLEQPKVDLHTALEGFRQWCPRGCVWGNGAAFDNAIMSSSYKALGMEQPWEFWHDRCYRTLKAMAPGIEIERMGDHHDALDDAVSQARHMQKIVQHLGITV